MNIRVVLYWVANLLKFTSPFIFLPGIVSLIYREKEFKSFIYAGLITLVSGFIVSYIFRDKKDSRIRIREGLCLVAFSWLAISFFGSLPYIFSGTFSNFFDAFFEAVSGFTTTGASVLTDFDSQPKGILFWRDFTHWLGGMGIIVFALAVLPHFAIGGMQIMQAEVPGPEPEKLKPRIAATARRLWAVYLVISAAEVIALHMAGMSLFDSFCHMFGTMGTGGFSTRESSIGSYNSPLIEMIVVVFMLLAGTNFVLHYYWLRGQPGRILKDPEFKLYISVVLVSTIVVTISLWGNVYQNLGESIRRAIFQVVSITTTTGYVTADFDRWTPISKGILFVLMFIGGCAGSTGGAMKQIRLLVLIKKIRQSMRKLIFPQAIIPIRLGKNSISDDDLMGILSFFLVYIGTFVVFTLIMLAFNLDLVSAAASVAATLGNIGPGFGLVGASKNYAFLCDGAKFILSLSMLIGRLELFTFLILIFPATWKK